MAHNNKVAADKTADDYWVEYFGEYGKMLTRDIPRVIKASILPAWRRSAAKQKRDLTLGTSTVVPLGYTAKDDGSLLLDGILKVSFTERGKRRIASRLFSAQFSGDGDLVSINHCAAPAA